MNWLRRWLSRPVYEPEYSYRAYRLDTIEEASFRRMLDADDSLPLCDLARQAERNPNDRTLSRLLSTVSPAEADRWIESRRICHLSVLSHHPNGWVRGRVVLALAQEGPWALSSLLVRANDWFPLIADAATERAIELFSQMELDTDLGAVASEIFRLSQQRRRDHSRLIEAYVDEVSRRRYTAESARRLTRGRARRWVFQNLRARDETEAETLEQALGTGDPAIALWACDRAEPFPELHERLRSNRVPAVRRRALAFADAPALERATVDPNAGVRDEARYRLGKRDYAAHYRALLPDPGAVSGLGETGGKGDAVLLRPLLEHSKAEIRQRALKATFRLIGDAAETELWAGLRDRSRKVNRTAVEALVASNLALDPERLCDLDLAPSMRWTLLNRAPRWAALITVLPRLETLPGAEAWIVRWAKTLGWTAIPPRPDEAAQARERIREAEPRLKTETAATLREAVSYWLRPL